MEGACPIKKALFVQIIAMNDDGDNVAAISQNDADPYEAFTACQAVIDARGV